VLWRELNVEPGDGLAGGMRLGTLRAGTVDLPDLDMQAARRGRRTPVEPRRRSPRRPAWPLEVLPRGRIDVVADVEHEEVGAEGTGVERRLDVVLDHHHAVQQVDSEERHLPVVDLCRNRGIDRYAHSPELVLWHVRSIWAATGLFGCERPIGHEPMMLLGADSCESLVVAVVVDQWHIRSLGRRADQEVDRQGCPMNPEACKQANKRLYDTID
jgi:hypothetical protein